MEIRPITELEFESLRSRGIFNHRTFQAELKTERQWIVEGLLADPSVNLLIGDSGLGKTPFSVALGISVAAGIDFLGRPTSKRRVLYCDAESTREDFNTMVGVISKNLGLAEPPPEFLFWSPSWETSANGEKADARLFGQVKATKAQLVLVDPLRPFWPEAVEKPPYAISMISKMRQTAASWLLTHHRRKSNEFTPKLADDPHAWFQEAAGSFSLINHTDTRLGVESIPQHHNADLVVGGFVRGRGRMPVTYLAREYDESGAPVGYQVATGVAFLNMKDQSVWGSLPEEFRFTDAKKAFGDKSDSNVKRFLDQCENLGIVKQRKSDKRYIKTSGVVGESQLNYSIH
jgi:hypothetical protein